MIMQYPPQKNLPHLTGIRAIAAYFVLFGHFFDARFSHGIYPLFHEYAVIWDYLGMSIFFVLSGFVITYSYYELFTKEKWSIASKKFFVARFARLYPLYIFVLILQPYIVVPALYYATNMERLSFLTLTQSWFNLQHVVFASAWSISTEWFFYWAFALFMGVISIIGLAHATSYNRVRALSLNFTVVFLLILYIIFIYREPLTNFLTAYITHRNNRLVWGWISYFSPFVRIGEFILGAFAARLYMLSSHKTDSSKQTKNKSIRLFVISMLCIALLGLYNVTYHGYGTFLYFLTNNFGFAPFIAYILYASCRYPGRFTRWCSHRWMVAGGEISYSLYMMQFIIFYWPLYTLFPKPEWYEPTTSEWFIVSFSVLFYIVITTFVSKLTYRFIEIPSRHYIRKKFDVHLKR